MRLTLQGGPASGAVVDVPEHKVNGLNPAVLSVTPAGKLYDRQAERYVYGATVVTLPDGHEQKHAQRYRGRPSTNLNLRDGRLPEHRPARSRPPRATVPEKHQRRAG